MTKLSDTHQARISVVIATFNEANSIERCLTSVKRWVDEIIVVDGTSSDATAELAKNMGAKVIFTSNKPIFHINKQIAMDAATGDIVLQLDADEVVDSELKSFIQSIQKNYQHTTYDTKSKPVAWWIKRKNLFLGRFLQKGGQYPDPVIRLYIAGFAKLPQKDVHEQMIVSGLTETANGHLIHYSNPTFGDYLRKWNAYSSLAAAELSKAGRGLTLGVGIEYLVIKPATTFLSLFVRHKGFVDGFPGFVFALMSGIFHQVVLLKTWELTQVRKS